MVGQGLDPTTVPITMRLLSSTQTATILRLCASLTREPYVAYASGFRVIFIADGTAARRDQDHNSALANIYRSFGDVRPTDEAIALLSVRRYPMFRSHVALSFLMCDRLSMEVLTAMKSGREVYLSGDTF